jgi:hypothetical protein
MAIFGIFCGVTVGERVDRNASGFLHMKGHVLKMFLSSLQRIPTSGYFATTKKILKILGFFGFWRGHNFLTEAPKKVVFT